MASVSTASGVAKEILAVGIDGTGKPAGHAVWFQNFNTDTAFLLKAMTSDTSSAEVSSGDFLLPKATSADVPSVLIVQSSGGDTSLVHCAWRALQAVGTKTIFCGRW